MDKTELVAELRARAQGAYERLGHLSVKLEDLLDWQAAGALELSAAREGALESALALWLKYDNLDEADFSEAGPMLLYAEAINATRAILTGGKAHD